MLNDSLFVSWITGVWYTKFKPRLTSGNRVLARIRPSMYHSSIQLDAEKSHDRIRSLLNGKKPCMIARYGFTESQLIGRYFIKQKTRMKSQYKKVANWLYNTAGFFSADGARTEADVDKFCELMIDYSKDVDLLGSHNGMLEDYVVNHCCPQSELVWFDNLAIASSPQHCWTNALKGKKVLVIHPFTETITNQYQRREKIWGGGMRSSLSLN